jgi:predicted dehydrogenase
MVQVGIIGAGAIAKSGYNGFTKSGQAEVAAICDMNERRLGEFATEFGIPKKYTDPNDLIADKDLDAVYVAVPNKFHAPLAKAALESGKNVILEKPFAMNLKEAQEVEAAVKASGKVFAIGMNQRFNEDSQKIKALVEDGAFGEIYHAKAYWFRRSGIPKAGTWFGNKQLSGGGCLLDIGVHMLDLALYTIGNFDAEAVSGATYSKFGSRGLGYGGWGKSDSEGLKFDVDDFATAMIKLKGGVTVALNVSWAIHQKPLNDHNVEIFGTEAGATCYPAEVFKFDPVLKTPYEIDKISAELRYPHTDRFVNFVKAILGEEEVCADVTQGIAIQKILDAIYESGTSGKEVRI